MVWQIILTAVVSAVAAGAAGIYVGLMLPEWTADDDDEYEDDYDMQETLDMLRGE